jgi:hypothetical protein
MLFLFPAQWGLLCFIFLSHLVLEMFVNYPKLILFLCCFLFKFLLISPLFVQKNWNLFSVSVAMAGTGLYQLSRKIRFVTGLANPCHPICRRILRWGCLCWLISSALQGRLLFRRKGGSCCVSGRIMTRPTGLINFNVLLATLESVWAALRRMLRHEPVIKIINVNALCRKKTWKCQLPHCITVWAKLKRCICKQLVVSQPFPRLCHESVAEYKFRCTNLKFFFFEKINK